MNVERRGMPTRSLAAIGIDEAEERIWRFLLSRRNATVADVAGALGLPARKAQRLLDSLEAKGLATCSPERPRRYLPISPEFAVEALIRQRQEELERVRAAIPDLQEQAARNAASPAEQMVELITSSQAVNQIFSRLQQSIQAEVICMQRAPVLFSSFDETDDAQKKALAKGVNVRSIADAEFLALPGAMNRVRHDMAAGEQVRVFPVLPFKMVVVDQRIGLIPLSLHEPDGPSLLVRSSALLDALCALFETLWERATPITFSVAGALKDGEAAARVPQAAARLIPLLAAGFNDKAIAHELDISPATLNRRMAELMRSLDTRTRFQAGWLAALNAFPERLATQPSKECDAPVDGSASRNAHRTPADR
jgi:sugar-specific transcriptional regulator TrmB